MNVLILKGYNNYFNRIVKKLSSATEYKNAVAGGTIGTVTVNNYIDLQDINFNPNDGVTTELIVGKGDLATWEGGENIITSEGIGAPDYLVCYKTQTGLITDPVLSRWFILEIERTRGGQYKLILRRDVIADHYDTVINSPVFVEKGYIRGSSPLRFNKENMEFNQIKQLEVPLKDETGCGWVVGYVPYDAFTDEAPTLIEKKVVVNANANITVAGISNWTYWKNCIENPNYKYIGSATGNARVDFRFKTKGLLVSNNPSFYCQTYWLGFTMNTNNCYLNVVNSTNVYSSGGWTPTYNFPDWFNNWCDIQEQVTSSYNKWTVDNVKKLTANIRSNSTLLGYVNSLIGGDVEIGDPSGLIALKDQIIHDTNTDKYYQIKLRSITANEPVVVTTATTAGQNIIAFMNANFDRDFGPLSSGVTGDLKSGEITVQLASSSYAVELEQVSINAFVSLDATRAHLVNAPYDMFCIPYSDNLQLIANSTDAWLERGFPCNKSVALAMASAIAEKSGSANVFDVQLLPYCPARSIIATTEAQWNWQLDEKLDIRGSSFDIIYQTNGTGTYTALPVQPSSQDALNEAIGVWGAVYYYDSDTQEYYQTTIYNSALTYYSRSPAGTTRLSAVIWCDSDSFDLEIPYWVSAMDSDSKISNECDLFRLVSPNYNGMFEFSPAKSGWITKFKAECTYKPYNPYIHIVPELEGLYGDNFYDIDDARGLICGGDFSLPQLSSAWANYELANKNYQKIFDRQMQNLDVNNAIQMQTAQIQAVTGALTGGIGGATTGALAGSKAGPYGAIAGAVVGGVAGTTTGIVGGAMDVSNLARLQQENKQYAIDMFGYNLQNIQAIPTSINKVSPLTNNTRIWPFIEYYTCTDREKQALRDKIKYNGMTVMAIDYPFNFIVANDPQFFKGQVIRLEGLGDDQHMAEAIYEEINKGVYI